MRDNSGNSRIPPGQRITTGFPVFTCGQTPEINQDEWTFTVFGIVEERIRWTFTEFRALPTTRILADFHCVTKWSRLDNVWEGVSAFEIMKHVKPTEPMPWVMIHCYDGYFTNLLFSDFCNENVIFAYRHNGHEIVREHGWPLRLIVPSLYGWKSAKWVTAVEFLAEEKAGYWEQRGYHMRGNPWKEERFSAKSE